MQNKFFGVLLCLGIASAFDAVLPLAPTTKAAESTRAHYLQFEPEIRALEAADRTNPPPKNAVLFIGSSSIRKWTTASAQFPEHKIINRGFGGSSLADSVAFADRILIPYHPKLILLYAGDNDIAGGQTPAEVLRAFQAFVAKVHKALPNTIIAFISIKPSPSREKFLEQDQEANGLIREFIGTDPRLIYLDVFTPMRTSDGHTRGELFVRDRLHLNEAGYELWAGIVGPVLDKFDPPQRQQR